MELKKGQKIIFTAIDDLIGKEEELTGKVIGDYMEIRKHFHEEMAEADGNLYLVKVENRSGLFVVSKEEIIEVLR